MGLEKLINPLHDLDGFKFPSFFNDPTQKTLTMMDKESSRFVILAILKHIPRGLIGGALAWIMFSDNYTPQISWASEGLLIDLSQYSLRYIYGIYQKNYK